VTAIATKGSNLIKATVMRNSFLSSLSKWIAALALCIACFLVSCGRKNNTPISANPVLQSITVSPKSSTIVRFDDQQYTAEGHYSDGSTKPLNNVAWALSNNNAAVNSTGLVQSLGVGHLVVTATSGGISGSAELKIERRIITEGNIPPDFTLANTMTLLYGNFNVETKSSIPATVSEKNETYPFFIGQVMESGVSKIFFGTYNSSEGVCHGCSAQLNMVVLVRSNGGWVVESSTKAPVNGGEYGEPSIDAHIVRIGPDRFGVELKGSSTHQGNGTSYVSILAPWKGKIHEAFTDITGEANVDCGEEKGMLPCVSFVKTIEFVRGANPDYDDMILTLSGTKLSDARPYKAVAIEGTERRIFADGKYIRVAPKP